jgi:hypothetical protein
MMGRTPLPSPHIPDAYPMPQTPEERTQARVAAEDAAQESEFDETRRSKQRAPLDAKRKTLEARLESLQERINERRTDRGRAPELLLTQKDELQRELDAVTQELDAIGGSRRRRRSTRSKKTTRRRKH